MNVLGLCAGIGGFELGLSVVVPDLCPISFCEQDKFCQEVLRRRFPATPIWDDVATFPSAGFSGRVDGITAGFPCQPWSIAGKRKGIEDHRWIWPQIASIIRDVGPSFVFLENVPGLLISGLGYVLGSLAEMGFDAEWGSFKCSSMGASQIRQRVFVLAYNHENRRKVRGSTHAYRANTRVSTSGICSPVATFPGIWAIGPKSEWGGVDPSFRPAIKPGFRRMVNGSPVYVDRENRRRRLGALGNGVSPPVVAIATVVLSKRLGVDL